MDEADIRSLINNVNARTVDAVIPLQGIRGRRSLGDAPSGTLVPLQEETSGSAPQNDIGSETQANLLYLRNHLFMT